MLDGTKMSNMRIICIMALLILLTFTGISCSQSNTGSPGESQRVAEEFVKKEATYRFDGIPETLKVTSTTSVGNGWQYTIEFDSRHAGYGNRSGQILAEVITHHIAEVTLQAGKVTKAIMDGQWDMISQSIDVEIKLAPIDEVRVYNMKSNPPQIGVYIKGGLPDGCTTFDNIETVREGDTINIKVTVQRPRGVYCPAIYTFFERDVNLGTDFAFGTTYTLNINDYTTTFSGTLMGGEGFAIYLTRDDIPPDQMEIQSHVDLADQPVISIKDIITYNGQTHEIKLTDQAFERITQLEVPVRGKSFLVCVDRAPIYWGAFWTPISSMSFDGVTIWKPLGPLELKVITLELGYPSSSFYKGGDPRNNTVILQSLEQSGKLINRLSITSIERLPGSSKGYELYSWQKDGQWHFTLITGTNRTKTMEEITSGEDYISETGWVKIHVVDVNPIKGVLSLLPQNESVSWCDELHIGQITETDLALPPVEIVEAIRGYAKQCSLDFKVAFY
jgi:hypothetical protein